MSLSLSFDHSNFFDEINTLAIADVNFSEQAEAVTSESEGEIEVAVPAGEEGGHYSSMAIFQLLGFPFCD